MLVRLAGLVSIDAPPISYLTNLGLGGDAGVEAEDVQQVLIGVAPVVGTARFAAAAGKMARARPGNRGSRGRPTRKGE